MVTKVSMRQTLIAMKQNQVEKIPMAMFSYNSIRNAASLLGLDMGRRYSVSVKREAGYTEVTRIL